MTQEGEIRFCFSVIYNSGRQWSVAQTVGATPRLTQTVRSTPGLSPNPSNPHPHLQQGLWGFRGSWGINQELFSWFFMSWHSVPLSHADPHTLTHLFFCFDNVIRFVYMPLFPESTRDSFLNSKTYLLVYKNRNLHKRHFVRWLSLLQRE